MSKRKYRKFKPELKFQIVLDVIRGNKSLIEIARNYDIHPQSIENWKSNFLNAGPSIFEDRREDRNTERRIKELEGIIGRQTIEIQFLKKVLDPLG